MSENNSSEIDPLLEEHERLVTNEGHGEVTPNYPATSRRRILRDCLVVVLLVLCISILITFLAIKRPTQDSSLLHDIRKLYNTPSLAAGALRNGSFSIEVTGLRKNDNPTLATEDDIWHLGSNTKAMTATILALLIEEGLLSWETTLSEALPAWSDGMLKEHQNTTVAMLGAHRGALSDEFSSEFLLGLYNFSSVEGRGQIAEFALMRPSMFAPGTQFLYSNCGYVMLGYIMEQITGLSWEDLVTTRIFEPLGMDNCFLGPRNTSIPPTNPWPHLVVNSTEITPLAPDIYGDIPLAVAPAGLVSCSLDSYSKFLRFHLNGYKGRHNANLTLSETSFRMLHNPWPGSRYSSGGWGVVDLEGVGHVLMHDGSNNLNYLRAMVVPGLEGAFIAATNIGFARDAVGEVINALIDRKLLANE